MVRSSNRRFAVVMLAGILIGMLVMGALPVGAGDGEVMHVGTKSVGKTVTRINTRGGLRVDNFKNGNPALILNVRTPELAPPMLVNSEVLVDNLNADLLDGKEASDLTITFYTRYGSFCLEMDSPADVYLSATCDAGDVAVGGGVVDFTDDGCTTDSAGNAGDIHGFKQDPDDPRTWLLQYEIGTWSGRYFRAQAVCADMP